MPNSTISNQTGHTGHWKTDVTQSGTIELQTAGTYVDRNIDIVVPKAVETVSGSASADVTVSVGSKSGSNYTISGSGNISGTATASVSTAGYTDDSSFTGSISGTASASGTVAAAAPTVTGSANVKPGTATKNANSNVSTGTIVTAKPSSGYYLGVDSTTAASTTITQTKGGTTGYLGDISTELTASGTVTGGTTTTYIPITSASTGTSASGTEVSTVTPGSSAQNVNITEGYTPAKYWQIGAVTLDIAKGITGSASIQTDASDPGTGYTENTTAVVPSGGYLKINAGYIPATKISLATLVPQGAAENPAAAAYIRQGYLAYDSDGALITGTMPDGSFANEGTSPTQTLSSGSIWTIKAGYYANDLVVQAQDSSSTDPAVLAATAAASATISSLSVGTKTSNKYAITGSSSISGTSTASVTTAGYASGSLTGTGSVSGTASVSATLNAITLGASATASATATGKTLTPSGSYGSYTFSVGTKITGSATASVTGAGYGKVGAESATTEYDGSPEGQILGTASISGTIASGKISGALHADSSKASGYDVYRINGNTAGWLPASSTSGNSCVNINVYQGTYTVS